jgi:hypothetical protein
MSKNIEITVAGPVGTGKSAVLGLIERELRREGFAFRYANPAEDIPEKAMADIIADLRGLDRGDITFVLAQAANIGCLAGERAIRAADRDAKVYTAADGVIGVALLAGAVTTFIDLAGNPAEPIDFDLHPVWGGIRDVIQDGQEMVFIPAFHYRAAPAPEGSPHAGLPCWWISAGPRDGFRLHPAFLRAGQAVSGILVGKHQASRDGDKAASKGGATPLTSIDFNAMRAACASRGDGWRLWTIYDLAAIQMLAMVEVGADLQELIGRGNVDGEGRKLCGSSDATWRGLTDLWGNVWQMVDGIITDDENLIRIFDAGGHRRWIDTGVTFGVDEEHGWPAGLHDEAGDGFDLGAIFLPDAVTDDRDDALLKDYCFGSWQGYECVAYVGGNWDSGANAGLFYLDLNDAASNSSPDIGGRLAKAI